MYFIFSGLPFCTLCPEVPQYCWLYGEEYCQTCKCCMGKLTLLEKDNNNTYKLDRMIFPFIVRKIYQRNSTITGCGNDRYFLDESGNIQCCNPLCSAGCSGPSAKRCFVSKVCHFYKFILWLVTSIGLPYSGE